MSAEPAAAAGDSILRGGAWTAISGVLPQLYTLLISVAAARILGPDDFGRQSFIAFTGVTIQMVLTIGLGIAVSRSVAEALGRGEPGAARGIVGWALRLQVLGALAGGGILVAAGLLGSSPSSAWVLAGAATAFAIVQSVPAAALAGAHRFRDAAVVGLTTGAVTVPVIIAVLAADGGIVGMFAVEAAVALINLVWIARLTRRAFSGPVSVRVPSIERAAVRFSAITTLGVLVSLVVWKRSEFFFLAHYSSDAEIALYSIAFAVVGAVTVLPERVTVMATPMFARMRGAGDERGIRDGFARTTRLLLLAVLPLAAGIAAVGPAFLELVYGSEYEDIGPIVVILAAGLPFAAITFTANSLLAALDDATRPLIAGAAAAVVNVALAFALIPGMDAVGAAWANVGGQLAAAGAVVWPAARAAGGLEWRPAELLRGVLAAGGSGVAAWAVVQLVGGVGGVVLGIAVGVAVFGALAAGLRVLAADDAAWADAVGGHLLGGRAGVLIRRAARRG